MSPQSTSPELKHSVPTAGFTSGHATISNNCQIITDGGFTGLDLTRPEPLTVRRIFFEQGFARLGSTAVAQSLSATIAANFLMDPGWYLDSTYVASPYAKQESTVPFTSTVSVRLKREIVRVDGRRTRILSL